MFQISIQIHSHYPSYKPDDQFQLKNPYFLSMKNPSSMKPCTEEATSLTMSTIIQPQVVIDVRIPSMCILILIYSPTYSSSKHPVVPFSHTDYTLADIGNCNATRGDVWLPQNILLERCLQRLFLENSLLVILQGDTMARHSSNWCRMIQQREVVKCLELKNAHTCRH